jgi:selenocysteine-specific elongation factor
LPLHLGDRLLLRDPHRRRVAGADVAAIDPAPLRRRGDARRIGVDLAVPRSSDDVVHRDHVVHAATLRMAGLVDVPLTARLVGDWWISTQRWDHWQSALRALVHGGGNGAAGIPLESVRRQLDAPSIPVVVAVAASLDGAVVVDSGRVRSATATAPSYADLTRLTERLAIAPLDAPSVEELRTLDPAALAHGVRIGQLLHLGHGIYVGAQAPRVVASTLESLPQPFTVSAARQALGASRRVVLPMLEHLDAARVTRRLEDGTRRLLAPPG